MIEVFADTSFFIALINDRDELHEASNAWIDSYVGKTCTTYWVLAEFANYFARHQRRVAVEPILAGIDADPTFTVLSPNENQFLQGRLLYQQRSDKHWSLVDCILFAVMGRRGLTTALTADHHFEQAGFQILLK